MSDDTTHQVHTSRAGLYIMVFLILMCSDCNGRLERIAKIEERLIRIEALLKKQYLPPEKLTSEEVDILQKMY